MLFTMNRWYILILTFFHLQLHSASGSSQTNLDGACSVKSKQVFNLKEESSFNGSFYISTEDPITFHVYFVGISKYDNNDLLILHPQRGWKQRKRLGEATSSNDTLQNDIPLGWNNMAIKLQDNNLYIGIYYTITGLKYDISEISVTARYMTDCTNRTPIWEINELDDVSIPLIGLSTFAITLSMDQPFHPHLVLNDFQIPLSYASKELVVRKSLDPLPVNNYRIVFVKYTNIISIFTISADEEYNLLTSTKLDEDLININVKTLGGAFFFTLDPFREEEYDVKTTIIKRKLIIKMKQEETTKSESENTHTSHAIKCEVKCETPSPIAWQITTALVSVFAAGSLCVHCYNHYSRDKKGKYQDLGMEEGVPHLEKHAKDLGMEEGVPHLEKHAKISARDQIKSEKTESHGKFNPEYGFQKEICKLMLQSDQKYRYKKTLGELNEEKQTKVVLVVGETGSGKSSTLNAMINHIYGLEYNDLFRFKLVDDMDSPQDYGINTTEEITSYNIPFTPGIINDSNYILIDTPGFGDLRGIDEDKKLVTKLFEFLKENSDITEIDAICFVIKASDTRLTNIQKYIISGLFSMFGKDIKRNIYVVVSFSDGSVTHVPKLLKDSGLEYELEMHINGDGLFNDSTEIEDLSDNEIQKDFHKSWNMTMSSMDTFFKSLKKKTPVSLILTNIVLEENEDITKLTDELLLLVDKETITTDAEHLKIQEKIEQNQSLLMTKLEEAKKLSGRLKNIPCKENPLAINAYVDMLIRSEKDENKKTKLEKLKKRNTIFQNLIKEKESNNYSIIKYFFGEKYEKIE